MSPLAPSPLFTPFTSRGVTFRNRIVASPMWQYSGEQGLPTDWHLVQLGRLAAGGAGLVFQEGTAVERRGCGTVGDIGLWDDRFMAPLKRLVAQVHEHGAAAGIQLMHAGRKARQLRPWEGTGALQPTPGITDWEDWDVVGPSAIPQGPGYTVPRPMSLGDIQAVIEAWVAAARRAAQVGYDVLEIHGAHGYLLHAFLSATSNQRDDAYGGTLAGRSRLLLEVAEGVRAVWPLDRPLFVRLSCVDEQGLTLEDTLAVARQLRTIGVDVIDCSSGGIGAASALAPRTLGYGYQVRYAREVRAHAHISTMAVGLIVNARQAQEVVRSGAADLVALGRELLYNPNWPIDAARKLGADASFANVDPRAGYWLARRDRSLPGFVYSTSGNELPS